MYDEDLESETEYREFLREAGIENADTVKLGRSEDGVWYIVSEEGP